jgi:hypothetical protein
VSLREQRVVHEEGLIGLVSIHDSWTELIEGTRFLLDILEREHQHQDKVKKINLLRVVVVSSFQMVEVMFFSQLKKRVQKQGEATKQLYKYDLDRQISFGEACRKWPEIITGEKFDFNLEPFLSIKLLADLRSSAIHPTLKNPKFNIGESALYTAIQSSKLIYNHFNENGWDWDESEYLKFVLNNDAKVETFLSSVMV